MFFTYLKKKKNGQIKKKQKNLTLYRLSRFKLDLHIRSILSKLSQNFVKTKSGILDLNMPNSLLL